MWCGEDLAPLFQYHRKPPAPFSRTVGHKASTVNRDCISWRPPACQGKELLGALGAGNIALPLNTTNPLMDHPTPPGGFHPKEAPNILKKAVAGCARH